MNAITRNERTSLWRKAKAFDSLARLYEELGKLLKNLPCPCDACGGCCDFAKAEHRLYASQLEVDYLLEKYELPKGALKHDVCPFLVDGQCSVRDRRMIGCRSYFRAHTKVEHIEAEAYYEKILSEVKKIYRELNQPWVYQDVMVQFRNDA